MSTVPHSLLVAFRGLRRNKPFIAVAVLTLALGIGASSVIFGIVSGVLFRPLPFERSNELVFLTHVSHAGEAPARCAPGPRLRRRWSCGRRRPGNPWHSGPNFLGLQEEAETLAGLAAYQEVRLTLSSGGEPALVPRATVSAPT
jgi:hypothetical protein